MTLEEFKSSLSAGKPPGLSPALAALWHDGSGDWDRAHEEAQAAGGADGSWVHAYLHRKEGDEGNAGYWYARAGRRAPSADVKAEWDAIARELLARRPAG